MADDFNSISASIWQDMRAGTPYEQPQVDTGPYTADFYGVEKGEKIKFKELVDFVKSLQKNKTIFNYADYAAKTFPGARPSEMSQPITYSNETYFVYTNENAEKVTTYLYGRLNKRIDFIEDSWGFIIDINLKDLSIVGTLQLYYDNTKQFRFDAGDTTDPDDFRISGKYIAIEIKSNNFTDYAYLVKTIKGDVSYKFIQKKIANTFFNKMQAIVSDSQANFLYSNIPDFAILQIRGLLKSEAIFKHLELLKSYDDTGWFSGYRDSSGAIITLLKIIGNVPELYFKFLDNPILVKELYLNMDGYSVYNGLPVINRIIFADLLYALCQSMQYTNQLDNNNKDNLAANLPIFKIGGNFRFDSNVRTSNDTYTDKIFLKQQVEHTVKYQRSYSNSFGIPSSNTVEDTYTYKTDVDEGHYYYPLQPIKLINADSISGGSDNKDESEFIVVPAIFIKAISDQAEWEVIHQNIRIGGNILAIVLGLATLGSSTGLATVLAVADITLAMADSAILLATEDLQKSEDGQAFLEAWDKVMIAGGIIVAPLLLDSIVTLGARVLSRATLEATKDFIRLRLVKIILEANITNFTGNTIKVLANGTEVYQETKTVIKILEATRLQQAGVAFVKGEVTVGKKVNTIYAAIYKSSIIASGDAKTIRDILGNVWNARGEKLIAALNEIYRNGGIPFLKGFSRDKILTMVKGERPNPSTYLPKNYITQHLKYFEEEQIVSRIVLKKDYLKYGIGKPDLGKTEYVALKSEIDKLLKESNGDISSLSKTLGVPLEQLEGGLVRIDFRLSSKNRPFVPSGNEFGTNPQWLPGGKLPTGELEATIRTEGLLIKKDYIVTDILFNK